jgi:drug/metabolite transporter superfamily protein YnfA
MYNTLADTIVLIHFLFIIFVVGGGLLVIRWPKMAIVHLPAAVWGASVEIFGWICPLTPLENHFRNLAGDNAYSGDFIARYLLPVIYPENLTHSVQQVLGTIVLAVNVIIYFIAIRKHRRIAKH